MWKHVDECRGVAVSCDGLPTDVFKGSLIQLFKVDWILSVARLQRVLHFIDECQILLIGRRSEKSQACTPTKTVR